MLVAFNVLVKGFLKIIPQYHLISINSLFCIYLVCPVQMVGVGSLPNKLSQCHAFFSVPKEASSHVCAQQTVMESVILQSIAVVSKRI